MKISLIINTYNKPELLDKSLTSLLSQTTKPDEIILADDGSTENLLSIAKEYKAYFKIPMKFVSQSDNGFRLARCRNNGAREAKGDFLFFLDQDIVCTKNFLLKMKKSIKKGYCIVGWPIRTTKSQMNKISREHVKQCNYLGLLQKYQIMNIKKQYRKDRLYNILNRLHLRKSGTKFRGGVTGIFKQDFLNVNGYDENYIGWGNEDDDLGIRLRASGVKVLNPFKNDFPIHLWHPTNHNHGERVNLVYYKKQKLSINKNNFKCKHGINNALDNDKYTILEI